MDHRTDLSFGDADNDAGSAFDPPLSGLDVAWDGVPALMLTDICTHPGFAKDLIPIHTLAPSNPADLQRHEAYSSIFNCQIPVHSGSVIDSSWTTSSSIASPKKKLTTRSASSRDSNR